MTHSRKALRNLLLASIAVIAALYAMIAALQRSDSATIKRAREVDAFIVDFCARSGNLPTSNVLRSQFPDLNRDSGWFYHTDDKTFLIVQYPVRWSNREAIGRPKTSEFTATVYAYTVDYRCGNARSQRPGSSNRAT